MKIKFIGLGIGNDYQAKVKVFCDNELIYDSFTYNGEINVPLKKNRIYKIKAWFINEYAEFCIIGRNLCVLFFDHSVLDDNSVTFFLLDEYYNLPIEKGVISLWQKI